MAWFTGVVVYILVWWVTLFAVLPLWVTPVSPEDPAYGIGAPQRPLMWRKLAVTSVIAGVIWAVIFGLVESPWLSFRSG